MELKFLLVVSLSCDMQMHIMIVYHIHYSTSILSSFLVTFCMVLKKGLNNLLDIYFRVHHLLIICWCIKHLVEHPILTLLLKIF